MSLSNNNNNNNRRVNVRIIFFVLGLSFIIFILLVVLPHQFQNTIFSNHPTGNSYRTLYGNRKCYHGHWSKNEWITSKECSIINYSPSRAAKCLNKRAQRIVMIGDSVHRELFWSLHQFFKSLSNNNNNNANANDKKFFQRSNDHARWNISVYKRFKSQKFTNFEDQDMIVKKNGKVQFSIRFVYASNAIDFNGRCKSIKTWFFQCLKTLEDILISTLQEETKRKAMLHPVPINRKSSDNLRGHHIDNLGDDDHNNKNNHNNDNNNNNMIFGTSKSSYSSINNQEKTILYFNTGLWDWRTGLLPKDYSNNLRKTLQKVEGILTKVYDNIIWRETTASWPSKFMKEKECKSKGKKDNRPCSVHTGEIYQMNQLSTPLIRTFGFKVVPSWEVTSTRPDLSYDGLHFRENRCKKKNKKNANIPSKENKNNVNNMKKNIVLNHSNEDENDSSCFKYKNKGKFYTINQVLNNFFFNELCLD